LKKELLIVGVMGMRIRLDQGWMSGDSRSVVPEVALRRGIPGWAAALVTALVTALGGMACGGGGGGGATTPTPAEIRLSPSSATLKVQGEVKVTATDAQGAAVAATYQVVEAGGGTVDASGRYLAPVTPGTYRVRARTAAGATAEATLAVEPYAAQLQRHADLLASRAHHTASLLGDGSVLVVGGVESSQAERYLPDTRTFQPAGDTGSRRWSHSAAPLPGGAWLFAGGLGFDGPSGPSGTLDSAAVYQGGTFSLLATRMATRRYDHPAVSLADGRVLLLGGLPRPGSDIPASTACEIFDPALRQFSATGSLALPRAGHTATLLKDGRVLVVGGRDSTCLFTCNAVTWRSAELYDPATGAFSPAGAMSQGRYGHTATLLPDGRVLLAGGTTPDLPDTDVSSLVEVFDPATGQFSVLGAMLRPRSSHTATLLGDGTVLLAGGLTYGAGENSMATATVEAFNPATGLSRLAVSDVTTRYRHAAVRLASGHVVLLGGTEGGGAIRVVERFD
jgi:hypothetical protein